MPDTKNINGKCVKETFGNRCKCTLCQEERAIASCEQNMGMTFDYEIGQWVE